MKNFSCPQEAPDPVAKTSVKATEHKEKCDHSGTSPGLLEPGREEGGALGKALVHLLVRDLASGEHLKLIRQL